MTFIFRLLDRNMIKLHFLIVQLLPLCFTSSLRRNRADMCEPIDVPLCRGMPYNMTSMPNHMHHSTQENARLAMDPYGELLKQNCSEDLLFFLCAMFAPICTPHFQKEAIPPCRAVCEKSRAGCEPLMNEHNFSWPDALNCDILPEYDKGVCVAPEAIVSSMPTDGIDPNKSEKKFSKQTKDCKCTDKNNNKPTKKRYKQGKYSFAIAVKVIKIRTVDEQQSFIQVKVIKVFKRGKLPIHDHRDTNLWVKSSCVCPKLKKNRDYFITGYEDVTLDRLIYTPNSLAARWNKRLESKIKTWHKRKRKRCRKRNGKTICRNRKSRRKIRCRVEMASETASRIKCKQDKRSTHKQNTPTATNKRHQRKSNRVQTERHSSEKKSPSDS